MKALTHCWPQKPWPIYKHGVHDLLLIPWTMDALSHLISDHGVPDPLLTTEALSHWCNTCADHRGPGPLLTMEALTSCWPQRPWPIADHRGPDPLLTMEALTSCWPWRLWPIAEHAGPDQLLSQLASCLQSAGQYYSIQLGETQQTCRLGGGPAYSMFDHQLEAVGFG